MKSFEEFLFISDLNENIENYTDLLFEYLEENTFFLLEKEKSSHSGIQPWDNIKGSSPDVDKELTATKEKYIEPIKNRFTQVLKRVAGVVKDAKVIVDVKSNKSILSKIVRNTPFNKMKDILRSALIVQNQEDIPKVMNVMRKNFNIYELKTKEKNKDPLGYYGSYHYIVDFKGVLIEVQLMSKRLWTYKELGHEIYTKWREKLSVNPELLTDPNLKSKNNDLYKDVSLSKRIFRRGNGAAYQL